MSVLDKITGGVPAKVVSHMVHRKHSATHHEVENHHTHAAHAREHHHFHGANALDQVHDHMEEHAGIPNPGEAEADAGQSGIPPAAMPAGVPGAGAPAAGPAMGA